MIYKYIPIFLIALLEFSCSVSSLTVIDSNKKFEIVYEADVQYARNNLWLKKIRDNWKATGINLRIYRASIENFDGKLNWDNESYNVDSTVQKIVDAGLNVYLRINLAVLNDQEVKAYNDSDFQIRSNGKRFLNQYYINKPLLNLTSEKSRGDMLNFIESVVKHLKTFPDKIQKKIKLIVPSLSPDDETELPFNTYDDSTRSIINNVLTGFSNPEIAAFMKYLENKYSSINSLNKAWGESANFTQFDSSQIRIRNYNWDGIKTNPKASDYYIFVNGRKDFLDFRREELKRFIDDCSSIVKKAGFNFGVQFGSIYDGLVEFRGFYDPTPLIEKADLLITDDILEYYPNFSFSADYSRSLCKYWDWKNKNEESKSFATEINWPGYADHNPKDLIKYWSLQLRTFYEKGASCLYVSQWGTLEGPNNISKKLASGSSFFDYKAWQDTLKKFQYAPVKIVSSSKAFQLACELGLNYKIDSTKDESGIPAFIHNMGATVGNIGGKNILEFPLNRFSRLKGVNKENIYYENEGDFVTDYMIQNSPGYIQNYKNFYLTGTSRFMPKSINIRIK